MTNYRQPKLEELHPNFRCEVQNTDSQWYPCTLKLDNHPYCGFILYAKLDGGRKVTIRSMEQLRLKKIS